MDPVASVLTFLSAIRTSVKAAKTLYNAPQELEKLQVEIDTFSIIFENVVSDTFDLRKENHAVKLAVDAAQSALVDIQQLIEFELVKDVSGEKKARRVAWERNFERVRALSDKLAEKRGCLQLALGCENVNATKQCKDVLAAIEDRTQQHYGNVERYLLEYSEQSQRHHGMLMEKLEGQDRQIKSQLLYLDDQKQQYHELEARFSRLLEAPPHVGALDEQLVRYQSHDGPRCRTLEAPKSPRLLSAVPKSPIATLSADVRFTDQIIAQVRDWMRDCNMMHAECVRISESYRMPTRLLDVGDEHTEVFLSDVHDQKDTAYVALSYMWGGPAPVVTTVSSLASRKQRIPWNILPRVFQNAIHIARKLDIQYLWIDALCILQDCVNDWEREASMMDSVFGNATLVIAAHGETAAAAELQLPDAAEGGLRNLDLSPTSSAVTSGARSVVAQCEGLSRSAWWTRGWTVQERMLARRLLHMKGHELFWECNHSIAPLQAPCANDGGLTIRQPSNGLKVLTSGLQMEEMSIQESLQVWWRLVEQYSSRQLSMQSDKLIALSGMASRFSAKLGTYIVGIWLDHDLAWNLSWRPCNVGERYSSYTGPSWSWASISGSVTAPRPITIRPAVQMIDYDPGQLGVNKFGAVSNAHLTLRGAYVESIVTGFEWVDDQCLIHLRKDDLNVTIASDVVEAIRPGTILVLLKILEDAEGDATCLVLRPTPQEISDTQCWQRVALISLCKRRGERRWLKHPHEAAFRLV